jgi:hypothetical protein
MPMKFIMPIRLLFFCLTVALCQRCKVPDQPSDTPEDSLTLVSQGIIEIPVDSVSLNYSIYPVYFVNDTAELYVDGNDYVNGIDFYDLDKRRRIKRIVFPREGTDGVKFAKKMYVQSLDSVYIYSDDDKLLTLVDYDGHVKKRWNLPNRTPWMVNVTAPLTIRDGFAYFSHMMFGDNKQQVGYTTMARYNLTTGEQEEYGPFYPDFFDKGLYMGFTPALTFGHDDYIVVRFGSLSDLYVYNMKTDSTRIISMKSRYEDASIAPDTVAQSFEEIDNEFELLVPDAYSSVRYSPYDHMYYSLFFDGIPITNEKGDKNEHLDKPVSIILFDEDFKKCGEVQLAANTYFPTFICSKKGLLIPRSHEKNPENDESKIQFEVFRPQARR